MKILPSNQINLLSLNTYDSLYALSIINFKMLCILRVMTLILLKVISSQYSKLFQLPLNEKRNGICIEALFQFLKKYCAGQVMINILFFYYMSYIPFEFYLKLFDTNRYSLRIRFKPKIHYSHKPMKSFISEKFFPQYFERPNDLTKQIKEKFH